MIQINFKELPDFTITRDKIKNFVLGWITALTIYDIVSNEGAQVSVYWDFITTEMAPIFGFLAEVIIFLPQLLIICVLSITDYCKSIDYILWSRAFFRVLDYTSTTMVVFVYNVLAHVFSLTTVYADSTPNFNYSGNNYNSPPRTDLVIFHDCSTLVYFKQLLKFIMLNISLAVLLLPTYTLFKVCRRLTFQAVQHISFLLVKIYLRFFLSTPEIKKIEPPTIYPWQPLITAYKIGRDIAATPAVVPTMHTTIQEVDLLVSPQGFTYQCDCKRVLQADYRVLSFLSQCSNIADKPNTSTQEQGVQGSVFTKCTRPSHLATLMFGSKVIGIITRVKAFIGYESYDTFMTCYHVLEVAMNRSPDGKLVMRTVIEGVEKDIPFEFRILYTSKIRDIVFITAHAKFMNACCTKQITMDRHAVKTNFYTIYAYGTVNTPTLVSKWSRSTFHTLERANAYTMYHGGSSTHSTSGSPIQSATGIVSMHLGNNTDMKGTQFNNLSHLNYAANLATFSGATRFKPALPVKESDTAYEKLYHQADYRAAFIDDEMQRMNEATPDYRDLVFDLDIARQQMLDAAYAFSKLRNGNASLLDRFQDEYGTMTEYELNHMVDDYEITKDEKEYEENLDRAMFETDTSLLQKVLPVKTAELKTHIVQPVPILKPIVKTVKVPYTLFGKSVTTKILKEKIKPKNLEEIPILENLEGKIKIDLEENIKLENKEKTVKESTIFGMDTFYKLSTAHLPTVMEGLPMDFDHKQENHRETDILEKLRAMALALKTNKASQESDDSISVPVFRNSSAAESLPNSLNSVNVSGKKMNKTNRNKRNRQRKKAKALAKASIITLPVVPIIKDGLESDSKLERRPPLRTML